MDVKNLPPIIGRLVYINKEVGYVYYCYDGSIHNLDDRFLYQVMFNFRQAMLFKGNIGRWQQNLDVPSDLLEIEQKKPTDMRKAIGKTMAVITEDKDLVIFDPTPFNELLVNDNHVNLISIKEYAVLHGKSPDRIRQLLKEKRIIGAIKVGKTFLIPELSPYPKKLSRLNKKTEKFNAMIHF